nr:aldose reductase [Cryptococcus depauperatus CBS 7855]
MVQMIKLLDGKSIPALAWGSGQSNFNYNHELTLERGIVALKAGFRHLDTAQMYKTEAANVSDKLPSEVDAIRKSVMASLDRLQFKPNLLLVHHSLVPSDGKIAQFWTALEELVFEGTLEGVSLGVSNFRPQDLKAVLEVARIKPVVNQLEYHPYVLAHLEPLLKLQAEHQIVTEAYGPLTPILRHPDGGPLKPILERIAERLSKEAGKPLDSIDVLLRWTMQNGVVAVTTSKTPERIQKLADVDGLPDLTKDELEEITRVGKTRHFRHYQGHIIDDFPPPDLPAI